MRGEARALLLAAALALALSLLAYAPALAPDRQLAKRDLFHLFYPLGKLVRDETRAGSLVPSARDPSRGLGVALLADPLAWSFYPPRLVHAALDYDLAFKLVLCLHGSLAGLGAFRLARSLEASRRSSLLAVAGATLAGPVLSLHRHPNLLAGAAWAPLALAFFLDAERREGRAERALLALAGACLGLMLLAGGFEIFLGLGLVLAPLVLASSTNHRGGRGPARPVAAAAFVLVLGAGLAAVQLVPTLEWLPTTLRPGAVAARDAYAWSLDAGRLPGLVLRPLDAAFVAQHGPELFTGEPFSQSAYLGVAIVALALRGFARDRRSWALGTGIALVLLASLGASGHVLPLLRYLPVYDRFRYPEKLLLLVAVLLPALSAIGLDRARRSSLARARPGAAAVAAAALVALSAADLAHGSASLLRTVPVELYRDPPGTVALVGSGRLLAGPGLLAVPGRPGVSEDPDALFLRIVKARQLVLAGGLAGLFGKEDASAYGPFAPTRLAELMKLTRAEEGFADLACVDTFLARPGSGYTKIWKGEPLSPDVVVLRPRSGPRARLVPVARRTTAMLAPEAFDALERYDREACFEGDLEDISAPGTPGEARPEGGRDADHLVVHTNAPGKRLLVLSALFLEGVRAYVDGERVPVVPADVALTGVPVPMGEHTVLVEWHVPGLALGACLTLASVVLALAFALAPSRRS